MKETIRYLREKQSLSQSQVANHLGISRQTYIKIESGEVEPSVSQLKMLASLYQVNILVLIENRYAIQEANSGPNVPLSNFPNQLSSHKEVIYETRPVTTLVLSSLPLVYEGVYDGTCVKPLNDNFPADINQKVSITLLDEYVVDKVALIEKTYGMLHHKADPSKWSLEEEAWAMHCVEKYGYLAKEREERQAREMEDEK